MRSEIYQTQEEKQCVDSTGVIRIRDSERRRVEAGGAGGGKGELVSHGKGVSVWGRWMCSGGGQWQ